MYLSKIFYYIVAIVIGIVGFGLIVMKYAIFDFSSTVVVGILTKGTTVVTNLSSRNMENLTYSTRSVNRDNDNRNVTFFKWSMSTEQMKRMLSLLNVFLRQIEKHNITYLPCGGTLIGTDRHHGQIPWDDDIDIMIRTDQRKQLISALNELSPQYTLLTYKKKVTGKWKFYKKDDYAIPWKTFRYPYIDIFFMSNYSTEEMFIELYPNAIFRKDDMYPLIRRTFNGVVIYTPCNMDSILKSTVSPQYSEICMSPYFNHSQETRIPKYYNVKCELLKNKFPFVKRDFVKMANKTFVNEDLIENGRLLQTIRYSLPNNCSKDLSYYPSDLELNVFYKR